MKQTNRLWCFLLLLIGGCLAGCSMPIQHGLTEREANQIIVLLSKAEPAIEATKLKDASGREVKWNIIVSTSDAPRAITMLQENNLPRKKEKGLRELYQTTGMIPTEVQERARYNMALSGDLNRTLKQIKGVLKANVLLAIPKEKSIIRPGEQAPEPKASALLIVQPEDFKTFQKKKILEKDAIKIISGAHEKLVAKNIKVVITDGGASSVMKSGSTAQGQGAPVRKVLFVKVATNDALKLRAFMFGSFGLIGILLIVCLLLFFRASSLKQQLNAASY